MPELRLTLVHLVVLSVLQAKTVINTVSGIRINSSDEKKQKKIKTINQICAF